MIFLRSKLGVSVIVLVLVFLFSLNQAGVFGDTRINISINTNPDLENGLIGHWTFDDFNSSTGVTTDRSVGGNDGTFAGISDPPTSPLVIEAGDTTRSDSNTSSATLSTTMPAYSDGDLVIVNLAYWQDNNDNNDITWPAGPNAETVTDIYSDYNSTTGNFDIILSAFGWFIGDGAYAGGTWTITADQVNTRYNVVYTVVPAGEFDSTTPIDSTTGVEFSTSDVTTPGFATFSAASDSGDGKAMAFIFVDQDPLSGTPTGWTDFQDDDAGRTSIVLSGRDTEVTDSESITGVDWTIAGDAYGGIGYIVRTAVGEATEFLNDKVKPGAIGQGIEFDGVDDYIEVFDGRISSDTQGTIVAWIKPDSLSTTNSIVAYGGGDVASPGDFVFEQITAGTLRIATRAEGDSPNNYTGTTVLNTGEWHHVVLTSDGSTWSMYINGVFEAISGGGSNDGDWFGDFTYTETDKTTIGAIMYDGTVTNFMDGSIDDVRIYDRTLLVDEIARLYELGATTHINTSINNNPDLDDGLLAHWTFDGKDINTADTSTEVKDISGNGYHLDMANYASVTDGSSPGVIGQSLAFNETGDNDIVNIASFPDITAAYTMSVWVKESIDSDGGEYYIQLSNNVRLSRYNLGYFDCAMRNGSWESMSSSFSPDDEVWYHVVCTYDGTTRYIYVDGVEKNSEVYSEATTNSALQFGWGDASASIHGSLDDARIYSRALSAEEVVRLYELGATTYINTSINANSDLENGLVGHWTFDGKDLDTSAATAEILDRSGSENNGDWKLHGTTTIPGAIGQAIYFDGVDDDIDLSSGLGISDSNFTISHWIKTTNSVGQNYTVGNAGGATGYRFGINSLGAVAFLVGNGTHTEANCGSIQGANDGKWHMITGVYDRNDSANFYCYIDGVLSGEVAIAAYASMSDVAPGFGDPPCCAIFEGAMDDVRIYNRSLSVDEINRLYQLGN